MDRSTQVKTEKEFDAAHRLIDDDGECGDLHGHRWKVVVWAKGDLGDDDMLFDFRDLKGIIDKFDHTYLNETVDFNPTAENIAHSILEELVSRNPDLEYRVRVHEGPKSYAEVQTSEGF